MGTSVSPWLGVRCKLDRRIASRTVLGPYAAYVCTPAEHEMRKYLPPPGPGDPADSANAGVEAGAVSLMKKLEAGVLLRTSTRPPLNLLLLLLLLLRLLLCLLLPSSARSAWVWSVSVRIHPEGQSRGHV